MKQELYGDFFKGKKVTMLGLGLLGRGIGDTAFLAKNGAEIIVTDKKGESDLASSVEALKEYSGITYHLGGHTLSDFEGRDFVMKAAGVPRESEYVAHALAHKIPVYMSAALVSSIAMKQLEGVTIIGVTGTRGKSTVTQMVAHVLRTNGMRVHVGGNVRGVANLPLLEVLEDGDFLVLELDSWQLQGFGDLKISPHIAVFTSFMDDHMNYYKNDHEAYFNDKANVYRNQTEYDVLIASSQASGEIMKREKKIHPIVPGDTHFTMKLIGEHNQIAARLTYEVALQCGLGDDEVKNAIVTFLPVEGRLEDIGVYGDKHVRVFNDNNATTEDATVAALNAINETYGKKPILIVGGADKGLPIMSLEEAVKEKTKVCVFLEGTGTARITLPMEHCKSTLAECVDTAFSLAEEGDVILFSPAFASFSKEFNNEYERSDAFVKAVKSRV